jgi:hypothetical protein
LLGAWIQPQHLDTSAVETYGKMFSDHPARLIVLDNFLLDEVAGKLGRFLTTEAVFRISYGLLSPDGRAGTIAGVSRQDWMKAKEQDRFFRFRELDGSARRFQSSPCMAVTQEFFGWLRGSNLRRYFEVICGLSLGEVKINAYAYKRGDFLRRHTDNDKRKRLAFVFYLSDGWEPRFGGELIMTGPGGSLTAIESRYNSLVLFDVTADSEHYVEQIKSAAGGRARVSISGWFYDA